MNFSQFSCFDGGRLSVVVDTRRRRW